MKGPIKTNIQIHGPYASREGLPEAWCYIENGIVEMHLQTEGPNNDLVHFVLKARVRKKNKKR